MQKRKETLKKVTKKMLTWGFVFGPILQIINFFVILACPWYRTRAMAGYAEFDKTQYFLDLPLAQIVSAAGIIVMLIGVACLLILLALKIHDFASPVFSRFK